MEADYKLWFSHFSSENCCKQLKPLYLNKKPKGSIHLISRPYRKMFSKSQIMHLKVLLFCTKLKILYINRTLGYGSEVFKSDSSIKEWCTRCVSLSSYTFLSQNIQYLLLLFLSLVKNFDPHPKSWSSSRSASWYPCDHELKNFSTNYLFEIK